MIVLKYKMHCASQELIAPPGQILKIMPLKDELFFWIRITDKHVPAIARKILIVPTGTSFDSKIYLDYIDTIFISSIKDAEPFVWHVFEEYAPPTDPRSPDYQKELTHGRR